MEKSKIINSNYNFHSNSEAWPNATLDCKNQRSQGEARFQGESFSLEDAISVLDLCMPSDIEEYNEHLYKVACFLYDSEITADQYEVLKKKLFSLMDSFSEFLNTDDPIHSKVYTTVEKSFDILIKLSTDTRSVELSTRSIRFLTMLMMSLNYWELYNLLNWKPAIYHFLTLIQFDLHECYAKFIRDYSKFKYNETVSNLQIRTRSRTRSSTHESEKSGTPISDDSSMGTYEAHSKSSTPSSFLFVNPASDDHEKSVSNNLPGSTPKEKKKIKADSKLAAHRVIKKTAATKASNKSSNYDPDVVHECQLPSPDEPDKLCLRRFSRKYELIRHQETVHSKKKKLFKCYVCVKQNPNIGPRIFTRHDTLAKHIRVNHKISGREAKAEVAYSKKHAEVVQEGDITVHVGRRKTKVDFELRAHMEKRRSDSATSDMEYESPHLVNAEIANSPGSVASPEENV